MKIKTPTQFQTFNDGLCRICRVENLADPGDMPKEGLSVKMERIPYERRTVGAVRYYNAKQAQVKAEELIRIPQTAEISTQDICIMQGRQYQIRQVQQIMDTMPPATDLSLQRLEADYDTERIS